jgi:hypothetical protein
MASRAAAKAHAFGSAVSQCGRATLARSHRCRLACRGDEGRLGWGRRNVNLNDVLTNTDSGQSPHCDFVQGCLQHNWEFTTDHVEIDIAVTK